jgi:hypothetical protein
MRRQKSPEKRQAEKERLNRFWRDRENRAIQRKADKLNKIMSDRKLQDVKLEDKTYTLTYKNGQVFRFSFLPDSLLLDRKIIPIFD